MTATQTAAQSSRQAYRRVRQHITADEWRFAGAETLLARRDEWQPVRDAARRCIAVELPSRSRAGLTHTVSRHQGVWHCTCEDFGSQRGQVQCSHVIAVNMALDAIPTKQAA